MITPWRSTDDRGAGGSNAGECWALSLAELPNVAFRATSPGGCARCGGCCWFGGGKLTASWVEPARLLSRRWLLVCWCWRRMRGAHPFYGCWVQPRRCELCGCEVCRRLEVLERDCTIAVAPDRRALAAMRGRGMILEEGSSTSA